MGTKNNPGAIDCYGNALDDEPMFILLGRDPNAPKLVAAWADARELAIHQGLRPQSDMSMVLEAHQCAANMREWRSKNDGKWRIKQNKLDIAYEQSKFTDLAKSVVNSDAEHRDRAFWEAKVAERIVLVEAKNDRLRDALMHQTRLAIEAIAEVERLETQLDGVRRALGIGVMVWSGEELMHVRPADGGGGQ